MQGGRITCKLGLKLAAVGLLCLALLAGPASRVQAELGDVAMFYDALSAYRTWIDYGNYGPGWYPTRVSAQWLPYLDGRFLPSGGGWVWVPGSTWYPATVAWPTRDDFIGWAPIPPPNSIPPTGFVSAGGFIPGTSALDLLAPPFWNFCRSRSFLLGFGQPFQPNLSFFNCGCLAPVNFVPTLFPRTALLSNFFLLGFAPNPNFVFGPEFSGVALFTTIPLTRINQFVNTVALLNLQNVVPTPLFLSKQPFLQQAIPAPVLAGQNVPVAAATNPAQARGELVLPGAVPPPANLPPLKKEIPQILRGPGRQKAKVASLERVRGLRLPPQADMETGQLPQESRRQRRMRQAGMGEAAQPGVRRVGRSQGGTKTGGPPQPSLQEEKPPEKLQEKMLLPQQQRVRQPPMRQQGIRPLPLRRPSSSHALPEGRTIR